MADLTFENAITAMERAHAKGDIAAARKMAALARSLQGQDRSQGPGPVQNFMGHVNAGIAGSLGGLVDLVNPLDDFGITGSAESGMRKGMKAIGAAVAEGEPQTAVEGFARGIGEATAVAVPAAKGLQAMGRAGGQIGQFADDAFRGLASAPGLIAEGAAGGASGAAREAVEGAGGPEWMQDTAGVLAPITLAGTVAVARNAPTLAGARFVQRRLATMLAPYTEAGGRVIAQERVQALAGGQTRAAEMAKEVGASEFGLTPAQQTNDPNMLALQDLAASQDPALRARLDDRAQRAQQAGRAAVADMGGDPNDARIFFEDRRKAFTTRAAARVEAAINAAEQQIARLGPSRGEADNSVLVTQRIRDALQVSLTEERALWDAVPKDVEVGTDNARLTAARILKETPQAQKADVATVIRDLLGRESGFGDAETVGEMYGLYSELRRVARAAMAGNDQNKNRARIANEVADAILIDLGAVAPGTDDVGRAINEARAFSAALHETFDRGAVGKILKRTLDGDTEIEPELALGATVGRMGVAGAVADRQIRAADPATADPISDYLMGQFEKATIAATGEFTRGSARRFIRDNDYLLRQYPELRDDIAAAVNAKESADAFAERVSRRIAQVQDARRSAGAAFMNEAPEASVRRIVQSTRPGETAQALAAEARKDKTGAALAGVKGAFVDFLIGRARGVAGGSETFSGDAILASMTDPRMRSALGKIFSAQEMRRLNYIATQMAKIEAPRSGAAANVGQSLSGAAPNKIIEFIARIAAARHGAALGGGSGGSIQTAGMASERIRAALQNLTADKASQIIADAIEDPELFRDLLVGIKSPKIEDRVLPKIVPYLIGGAAASAQE